jgi:hypothetical protein
VSSSNTHVKTTVSGGKVVLTEAGVCVQGSGGAESKTVT